MSNLYDVLVVGGGPAGSTAGALLASEGHRVLIVDKERFPRFHVGESLLPAELPIFAKLGFDAKAVPALYKSGADFLDERTGERASFLFRDGLSGTEPHAWQVDRATFDDRLLRRAAEMGAEVRYEVEICNTRAEDEVVAVTRSGEELRARYLIDASGRDRIMCKQLKSYERLDGFGVAAVWGHFSELRPEVVARLEETGNITVLILPDKAWGWVVPLVNGRLSVGFVSAVAGVVSEAWWDAQYAASPFLQELTAGSPRTGLHMTGDYSYKNLTPYGARWGCVGDSSYFLDPVFSSGVTIAMCGAEKLTELLSPALREGREDDPELLAPLVAHMSTAFDVFGAIVWSFYHTGLVKNLFFYDDPDPELRAGLVSVLAGDIWRSDNKFQQMILRSRRRRPAAR